MTEGTGGLSRGLDRRTFVGSAAAAGALIALEGPFAFAEAAARSRERNRLPLQRISRSGSFASGVGAGQPNQRAVTLWTRLHDVSGNSLVELEIGEDPDFRRVVHREAVRASALRDFTVHRRVRGRFLQPGEPYWYRFSTRNTHSDVGRFKTALPPDSRRPVRIGVFSCQEWQAGYFTAHSGLAAEDDLDLVVSLGDYIYERNFYEGPRTDTLGANGDGEVQTLEEYRAKYRLYRSDPNLRAMHAAHAYIPIWDDHEVEDNHAGDLPGEATINPRVDYAERKRVAYLSYFENHPVERIRSERDRIYRRLRLGANADLFLLDQRQYREDQPCGDAFFTPCPDTAEPRRFLGPTQMQWLKRSLSGSEAAWKLIGNQLMIMSLDTPQGNPIVKDSWDGYEAERNELLGHIRANGIEDVSFLTGDIHTFFAGQVHPGGRGGLGKPAPVATEFVCGSITSLGVPETLAATTGVPLSRETYLTISNNLPLVNPHFAYTEQSSRGYAVVEARADALEVTYKAPQTVMTPESEIRTLERLRVGRGSARVRIV